MMVGHVGKMPTTSARRRNSRSSRSGGLLDQIWSQRTWSGATSASASAAVGKRLSSCSTTRPSRAVAGALIRLGEHEVDQGGDQVLGRPRAAAQFDHLVGRLRNGWSVGRVRSNQVVVVELGGSLHSRAAAKLDRCQVSWPLASPTRHSTSRSPYSRSAERSTPLYRQLRSRTSGDPGVRKASGPLSEPRRDPAPRQRERCEGIEKPTDATGGARPRSRLGGRGHAPAPRRQPQ